MMRKAFRQPLEAVAGFPELKKNLPGRKGLTEIFGASESQKAHIAAGLAEGRSRTLILAENELKARNLYEDLRLYEPDALYYPARDLIFYQAEISGNLLTRQRLQVLKALMEQERVVIVTSAGGCMDYLLPFRMLEKEIFRIHPGEEQDPEKLAGRLVRIGYERFGEVESPGQFAVRGGILDIWSLTAELPWRIEFWDTEVDSIRSFDPESQRSVEMLDEARIDPATEEIGTTPEGVNPNRTDTLLDYFDRNDLIILDEPIRILENAGSLFAEYSDAAAHRIEAGKLKPEAADRMITPEMLTEELNLRCCAGLSILQMPASDFHVVDQMGLSVQTVGSYQNQFSLLVKDLIRWKRQKFRVILLSASHTRARRLAQNLTDEGADAFYSEDPERTPDAGQIMVIYGNARKGFVYPMQKFVLIPETDIFGRVKKKNRSARRKNPDRIRSVAELSAGDYVIHESHGLGIYRGIEKVVVDHTTRDYIRLEYSGGGGLLVPATQLDLLQKYGSADGRKPRLNSLGGQEWNKTKNRVKTAVKNIAKELVELYAARQNAQGYAYGPDTVWQKEFEELFPYEETDDQLQAIEDTKKDMESTGIMDRLICGDVGYGKTEVAIRAAFKAVQENKQVVFLTPTTVLAQQHYNTFVQRMKDYPVNISLLCRFRTPAQQKKTLEELNKGQVDILIGTHRVLSKDVRFHDLGLLIIDEEQRFGVSHKEKIKQMKHDVDVLSLTATPIPRTLHMSMIGIRDMSILEEAPLDRLPVQTYVCEYDGEMVREALGRELARDGQVYFVHNRVNDIADAAARIQELVPDARVEYAHGRMPEHRLEDIMYRFVEGEIDVLVSTTIIETGLDIPNVNTIIIDGAERMGLSQLYQLRGRVGRSNRNAYAFLMYKKDRMLKEEAEKRLGAIRQFTELGSGVQIALRDLEIRGAGNLLGAEQHGHMEAVGYDLYCKMLSAAVREEKGGKEEQSFETSVDLNMDAFIPGSFIPEEGQKLDVYKRISGVQTGEEASDMADELADRYGDVPASVNNLIQIALLKTEANRAYITEIREERLQIRISMFPEARLDASGFPELLEYFNGRFRMNPGKTPWFSYLKKEVRMPPGKLLKTLRSFCEKLCALRLPEAR